MMAQRQVSQNTEYFLQITREAAFDADISSGSLRLLATPASTDTMVFKVVAHSTFIGGEWNQMATEKDFKIKTG